MNVYAEIAIGIIESEEGRRIIHAALADPPFTIADDE